MATGPILHRIAILFCVFVSLGASAATGYKTGEQISGFTRICYYNVLGSPYSINVPAMQFCPPTIQANNPSPAAPMPQIGTVGRVGYFKGEVREGMNKICYYNVLGSTATLTLSAVSICPITHSF